jgi:hypothetical protein
VATRVALLSRDQVDKLPERAREVVEYRKSGASAMPTSKERSSQARTSKTLI